jgi:hypothetical protein
VRISIAEFGRRFGVSRPQVVRVLDKAVDVSLIERSGRDGLQITVLPRLRSVTEDSYVTAFVLCDQSADGAKSTSSQLASFAFRFLRLGS